MAGIQCDKCGAKAKVKKTVTKGGRVTVRYMVCPTCGARFTSTERVDREPAKKIPVFSK